MVFDRLTEIEVKTFRDYAVFVKKDFSEIIIEKCKISEPVLTKCHGVIPNNSPKGYFNCLIGDYQEERCSIIIAPRKYSLSSAYTFGCSYDTNFYYKSISSQNVDKLINESNGYYIGFFKTKEKAYNNIIKVRKKYIEDLERKIKSVINDSKIQKDLEEAYAEHKRNKDI